MPFKSGLDYLSTGVGFVGLDGSFLYGNQKLWSELRVGDPGKCGRRFQDITHPDDLDEDLRNVDRLLRGDTGSYAMDKRYIDDQGNPFWALLNVSIVLARDGSPEYFSITVQDIDARKRKELKLQKLAYVDKLTALPNRAAFEEQALAALQDRVQTGLPVTLVFFDLDGLKRINDRWGHDAGDFALKRAAAHLKSYFGPENMIARLGGDEFVLLCRSPRRLVEKRCRELPAASVFLGAETRYMAFSFGTASYGCDGTTLRDLMRSADQRMYAQKMRLPLHLGQLQHI